MHINTSIFATAAIRLHARLERHRNATRVLRELEGTSDRALAELGIARGDIGSVARAAGG